MFKVGDYVTKKHTDRVSDELIQKFTGEVIKLRNIAAFKRVDSRQPYEVVIERKDGSEFTDNFYMFKIDKYKTRDKRLEKLLDE
ncbi:MAG: hypothetical protein SLAVMIC_00370 [uncultured marine phage]|uniref:Uncharacterized protein n=1 Tax=uncultured marine phage TaxID=707152 RepID=A0A8D9CE23_9VIRU|nr:MAG: hypothetical protein SLAVMIC_00370 [uncultured marine phage]